MVPWKEVLDECIDFVDDDYLFRVSEDPEGEQACLAVLYDYPDRPLTELLRGRIQERLFVLFTMQFRENGSFLPLSNRKDVRKVNEIMTDVPQRFPHFVTYGFFSGLYHIHIGDKQKAKALLEGLSHFPPNADWTMEQLGEYLGQVLPGSRIQSSCVQQYQLRPDFFINQWVSAMRKLVSLRACEGEIREALELGRAVLAVAPDDLPMASATREVRVTGEEKKWGRSMCRVELQ